MVHSGVTNFPFIRWIIETKCKLIQKSFLRYSGSYLPTTPSLSVILVSKQIPGGGTFYCPIALYPDRQLNGNPHETADIEAKNSFQNRDGVTNNTLTLGRGNKPIKPYLIKGINQSAFHMQICFFCLCSFFFWGGGGGGLFFCFVYFLLGGGVMEAAFIHIGVD